MSEQNSDRQPPLASERAKGKGTMYFFDVRNAKNGRIYLSICTSRKKIGQEKPERNCIFIFEDDLNDFINSMAKISDSVDKLLNK